MFKKQLAAVNILLSIAISLFNGGLALKCYECQGFQEEGGQCWENPKEAKLIECGADVTPTAAPVTKTASPTISATPATPENITETPSRKRRSADLTQVATTPLQTAEWECVKIALTLKSPDANNYPQVFRGCAKKSLGICDVVEKQPEVKEVSFCGVCAEDGCNSSPTLTLWLITYLPSVSILMLLAH